MKTVMMSAALAVCAVAMTGCMTRSRLIPQGATAEVVAGFSQDDIESVLETVREEINKASMRYAVPGHRRVINVKDILNDTLSRGRDADFLSETLGEGIREKLTESGNFIVYNEKMAQNAAGAGQVVTTMPEFVMFGNLKQRNVHKDNGDVYQEFALHIRLVDVKTQLEFWQKRIPLRKEVGRVNSMN